MARKWTLVDNAAQAVHKFTTRRELVAYVREHGLRVRRSPLDDRGYYTDAVGWLPRGYLDHGQTVREV